MGGRILTIFQIKVSVIIFLLISSIIITDVQSTRMKEYTESFAETVRHKGYITKEMYEDYLKSVSLTTIKISLIHDKRSPFLKDDVLNLRFTRDIVEEIYRNGIYKLKVGDDFEVILRKATPKYFDTIIGILTQKIPSRYKVIAAKGGMILNEQYH